MIRELIYDFKEWQSIEATGRSGSDEGFDVRAFERIPRELSDDLDEEDQLLHPMEGNLWMIQGKRERELGPAKIRKILSDIDASYPPYGYVLAAPVNFSKKSYDAFREVLREKNVMEFALWGKAELEDMLHLPKNDRILFTFFGISLTSKRKSRATQVRSTIAVKNKLFRTFGDVNSIQEQPVLIRDINDAQYPSKSAYIDFSRRPRWKEYEIVAYNVHGVFLKIHKYLACANIKTKQWDQITEADLFYRQVESDEDRDRRFDAINKAERAWNFLRKINQAHLTIYGLIKFENILLIDDKGDPLYNFPHLYVEFTGQNGPFDRFLKKLNAVGEEFWLDSEWSRFNVFPKPIPETKIRKVHKQKKVVLDPDSLKYFLSPHAKDVAFYDGSGRYKYLKLGDVVAVAESDRGDGESHIHITNIYPTTVGDHFDEYSPYFYVHDNLLHQLGLEKFEGNKNREIVVYEFKRIFRWEFDSK